MATDPISYDKAELRAITRSFKAMDDEAISQAKEKSSALADFVLTKTRAAARNTQGNSKVATRIADGAKVSKSSKLGEISYGYAGQKFSGGATTQSLWGGNEFGSINFRQFPTRRSRGWWIYPTLRALQPDIVKRWEEGFSDIVKRFD
jgi:hypothetical protein